MENGVIRSNNSTGFRVSEKDSTLLPLQNGHVGLGLNLQSTQTFPPSMKGRGHHHYYHDHPDDDDHHRPLSSSGALNGSVGPTPNSGPTEAVGCGSTADPTHIYADGDDVAIPIATCSSGGAAVTALQSFDISIPATSTVLKSPGGGDMAAAALGYPFTSAQWKELERQAMIYKYMMASVPVPPDLLLPIVQSASAIVPTASHSSLGNGSLFNLSLRFSSNNKDPEPGRCKRTDGKKWRCSRDAAPQQKYCERHMHRGRPRSRKPVEVQQPPFNSTMSKKSRLHHHPLPPTPTSTLPNPKAHTTISSPQLLRSTFPLNETPSSDGNISASSYKENGRSLDWAMEGEMLTMDGSEQQWQHFLQAATGLTTNGSVFQQEPRHRIAYTDFGALEADQQNDDCSLFLNPDLVCIEKQAQVETPRGFIDAWSNDPKTNVNIEKNNDSSVCSHCNLSFSDLTLSMAMAAGNAIGEGMGQIPVGIGIRDSNDFKPQVWLGPGPGPWLGSNPGGPLAEVLRPTSCTAVSSDPTSPRGCCNGDSTSSTPATRASSPSGVLQRAMLSLSDSSGCNSPTIAASTAMPEMKPFQWLS